MKEEMLKFITEPITITYLGAICGHIMSIYSSEFKGAMPFLEKFFPNKQAVFYFRIDFLILPIIGALLAYFLLSPDDIKESLFAGLSWSGTLTAVLKKTSTSQN